MSLVGQVLKERYQFIAEIGKGGMSTVYLAKDLNLDSYWAIKQVKNNSSVEFDSFLKEVELLASLSYSDIPRIVDRVERGDDYFVIMDFIDGTSLSKIVNIEGPQPEETVIEWGVKLCDILEYLHTARENPIVYRDMKPDNVMLTPSGSIKLIDFGIAKECIRGQRAGGDALGTRGYAAPEQYKGASNVLDERSDIYSLGATLFYLATGIVPSKPPNGVPALRSVAANLSDSLEYVIAKCTADDPDNRYNNVAEVRADLENIERLSGLYRKKMKTRLLLFWASLMMSMVFAVVGWVGYGRYQADLEDAFRAAYQTAAAYDREGDYLNASRYYAQAINAKPADRETHVLLLNALLPHSGGEEAKAQTMAAIDEMRKSYLDNTASPMYNDPQLSYAVVRRCIEVQDPAYAEYALAYIEVIEASEAYEEGSMRARELQNLKVIAAFQAQDSATADYEAFEEALVDLQDYTDTESLTPDEKLGNYYILVQMYSTYPSMLPDAYTRAYELGNKAKDVLLQNADNEDIEFNNIVPLYELVAVGQYNSGGMSVVDSEREQAYKKSIEWFEYLDELNVELSESLLLKKANAYKGVFDVYNTPQSIGRMTAEIEGYLHTAIGLYEQIVQNNSQSFVGRLYLTEAYVNLEMLRPQEERNMENAMSSYRQTQALANTQSDIPGTALMRFASLKQLMQTAGLEV